MLSLNLKLMFEQSVIFGLKQKIAKCKERTISEDSGKLRHLSSCNWPSHPRVKTDAYLILSISSAFWMHVTIRPLMVGWCIISRVGDLHNFMLLLLWDEAWNETSVQVSIGYIIMWADFKRSRTSDRFRRTWRSSTRFQLHRLTLLADE
jgi:hypothetical protein